MKSLGSFTPELVDLLWNNENWTIFYNGHALSISDVAILVHLHFRLFILHIVS